MNVIKSHDITLYGGYGSNLILKPSGGGRLPATSRSGYAFAIVLDDKVVGECLLAKANSDLAKQAHPAGTNIKRVDIIFGEEEHWAGGIGSQVISLLVDYAFHGENADVVYAIISDFDTGSKHAFEKVGFELAFADKEDLYYCFSKHDFVARRRVQIPAEQQFALSLDGLTPSQLYISSGKLAMVQEWFDADNLENFDPIPVKRLGDKIMMTDGHTRAVAAHLAGLSTISAYWDEDELDMQVYEIFVDWCKEEGIASPIHLASRVISHKDYQELWLKCCTYMQK